MAKGWTCARPRRPLSWAQRLISPTSAGSPYAGLSLAQFGCACDSWRWQGTWHPLTAPRHICFLVRAPPLLVYELQPFRRACLGARCIRLCWHALASCGEIFGATDRPSDITPPGLADPCPIVYPVLPTRCGGRAVPFLLASWAAVSEVFLCNGV